MFFTFWNSFLPIQFYVLSLFKTHEQTKKQKENPKPNQTKKTPQKQKSKPTSQGAVRPKKKEKQSETKCCTQCFHHRAH